MTAAHDQHQMKLLPRLILMARWIQVLLYVGLAVAQCANRTHIKAWLWEAWSG